MLDLSQYNYDGNIPKPSFNTSFYSGEDIYSDGNVEDDIIHIIANNPTTNYEEDINRNFSWPVFYHLTRIRQNILNWYPFENNSNILEIGCGMGAITELLCKRVKSVTAVELSKKRATAAYLRCRNYDNLEIIVGNLNDIQFNKKYDYITLIGVLEYQNKYTNSTNPFVDFLKKIRTLLKPNGKLLIALENKYGIKYWCGTPEDHSGIPFDGINNYKFSNIAKTFSKSELNKLIINSGFNYSYFYYPLPDYKMPQVIYSENYLPRNGSIDNWIPYNSFNSNSMVSDEELLYHDIVNNNVFEFFANSFLVECSIYNEKMGEVDYAVSSPFRKAEFDCMTIHSGDKGFYKMTTYSNQNFLSNIKANHTELSNRGLSVCNTKIVDNILYTQTIKGTPLTDILIDAYKTRYEQNVYKIYDKIYDEIKQSSEESYTLNNIFNSSEDLYLEQLDNNDRLLMNGFIDMIHKNCFIDTSGTFPWIDQEWCFNNIPASFILYQNIVELHMANPWLNSYICIENIIQHYNLSGKKHCYYAFKNIILNSIQNKYSTDNYKQLCSFNNEQLNNNIIMLYNNLNNITSTT